MTRLPSGALRRRAGLLTAAATAGLLLAAPARAAGPETQDERHEANRAAAAAADAANAERFRGNPDILLLPGLIADRTQRVVRFRAEAAGRTADEIAEFLVISENSAHGYEALALSFAAPSAIHRALEFIGMKPGQPADPARTAFWPKGERAMMSVAATGGAAGSGDPFPVEELILDRRTGKNLPPAGLVFVGSTNIAATESGQPSGYAADVREPNSIAATYNEPESVLDFPQRASQGEVYGQIVADKERIFPPFTPLEFTLRPERGTNQPPRVVEFGLTLAPASGSNAPAEGVAFCLTPAGSNAPERLGVKQAVERFARLVQEERDPFVTVRFDGALPLGAARAASALLATIENSRGIRIEPPPAGELYYKALLPSENYRLREERIAQPWELRLASTNGAVRGTLVKIEEEWKSDSIRPVLHPQDFPVNGPEDLQRLLKEHGPGLSVILVFTPPSLTYGDVMRYIRPVYDKYPTIYVLLEAQK